MTVAVIVAVHNNEKNISQLIEALLQQTRLPDEIIVVDDGSTDKTVEFLERIAGSNNKIKIYRQKNAGPAAARNKGFRSAGSDICVFTDSDCVPEPDWIENLLMPFKDKQVAAAGGTYKTLNNNSALARFIGLEIAWRYRNIKGEIDVHGTYNLAVRKSVLEEVGGFNREFPKPSGEDWDLTYKISQKYKIIYVPQAVVGHYHPEKLIAYLKNQERRAFDRIKVYKEHPDKRSSDTYTGPVIKYQILGSAAFLPSLLLLYPWFSFSYSVPLAIFAFLLLTTLPVFFYTADKDLEVSLQSIPVQLLRNFAWLVGLIKGLIKFGI